MTDVIVIAVIVAFFLLAALLVSALDRLIANSGNDAEYEDAEYEEERDAGPARAPGRAS
jgi:hypothetical protein